MSSGQKWNFRNLFKAINGGCGCGRQSSGPKSPTDAVVPKPISKTSCRPSSTTTAAMDGCTSSTSSLVSDSSSKLRPENHHCPEIISADSKFDDSLAVVQDSDDPYGDFRQSMLQMICEKEIYSGNELQHLLHCFLELNSSSHHEVIVRAFMEIWNGGEAEEDDGEPAIFSNTVTCERANDRI